MSTAMSTPARSGTSTPASVDTDDSNDVVLRERDQLLDGLEANKAPPDRITPYLALLTTFICVSGLLFGLDTGIVSGILVNIGSDLGHALSNGEKELITSITTAGALVGGVVAVASDRFGRKTMLSLADVMFVSGAVLQAAAHNVATMSAGRCIIGLGVGLASGTAPLLIGELAPTHIRGSLTTTNVLAITFGQVVAYAIGAAFEHTTNGWRWMSGLCAIPAGCQIVALHFLTDSPRQLIGRGDVAGAKHALRKIYANETAAQIDARSEQLRRETAEHAQLLRTNPAAKRLREMVKIGSNRRALIVACALQALQQLCGFNSLTYFAPTLFASMGFTNATAVGLIISGTNFLGTITAIRIIDTIGRRRILLCTVPGMVCGLLLAAIFFHFLTESTGGRLDPSASYPSSLTAVTLFALVVFVASYSVGIGNVPWLQGELFTIAYRGIGSGCGTTTNWSSNLIIASTFLSLQDAITPTGAFSLYAGICLLGFVFVYVCYPETAGLSIDEVQTVFKSGFGKRRRSSLAMQ